MFSKRADSLCIVVMWTQWHLVIVGFVSLALAHPGPGARYNEHYGPPYNHGDSGPDPRKAYEFNYQTPAQGRREASDVNGDVRGRYNFVDDMGVHRTVDYIAGKNTGFVVTNETPDPSPANEASYYKANRPGALFGTYEGTRGFLSSKLNVDGTYNFKHSSPHQSHSEVKDAYGRVQGEYSYFDDQGKMHFVQYEAGPGIGFRVLNTNDGKPTPVGTPFQTNSYGQTSFIQSRAGRFPDPNKERTTKFTDAADGTVKLAMRDSAVYVHHHGQVGTKDKDGSDKVVKIAWDPSAKKLTAFSGKMFTNTAEEYEHAPELDAIDYFLDVDSRSLKSGQQKNLEKGAFIINVPDPVFAFRGDGFSVGQILSPLSPSEQDAINKLKDLSQDRQKMRQWNKPSAEEQLKLGRQFENSGENYGASSTLSRRWAPEESLVDLGDVQNLKSRINTNTPRLAQIISLD